MASEFGFPNDSTPVGSTAYYSIRYCSSELQDTLAGIYAFHRTLRAIPVECSEDTVALSKLNWWREELDRLFDNNSQYSLFLYNADEIRCSAGGTLYLTHTLPLDTWTHLACTHDGSTLTTWIDGVSRGSMPVGKRSRAGTRSASLLHPRSSCSSTRLTETWSVSPRRSSNACTSA